MQTKIFSLILLLLAVSNGFSQTSCTPLTLAALKKIYLAAEREDMLYAGNFIKVEEEMEDYDHYGRCMKTICSNQDSVVSNYNESIHVFLSSNHLSYKTFSTKNYLAFAAVIRKFRYVGAHAMPELNQTIKWYFDGKMYYGISSYPYRCAGGGSVNAYDISLQLDKPYAGD